MSNTQSDQLPITVWVEIEHGMITYAASEVPDITLILVDYDIDGVDEADLHYDEQGHSYTRTELHVAAKGATPHDMTKRLGRGICGRTGLG